MLEDGRIRSWLGMDEVNHGDCRNRHGDLAILEDSEDDVAMEPLD